MYVPRTGILRHKILTVFWKHCPYYKHWLALTHSNPNYNHRELFLSHIGSLHMCCRRVSWCSAQPVLLSSLILVWATSRKGNASPRVPPALWKVLSLLFGQNWTLPIQTACEHTSNLKDKRHPVRLAWRLKAAPTPQRYHLKPSKTKITTIVIQT